MFLHYVLLVPLTPLGLFQGNQSLYHCDSGFSVCNMIDGLSQYSVNVSLMISVGRT